MKGVILLWGNSVFSLVNFRSELIINLHANYTLIFLIPARDQSSREFLAKYGTVLSIPYSQNMWRVDYFLRTMFNFLLIVKKYNVSIILTFTIIPNIIATSLRILHRKHVVCNVTGLGRTGDSKFIMKFYQTMLQAASWTFLQNKYDNQKLKLKKSFSILPGSGINLQDFILRDCKRDLGSPLNILYASRLLYKKGVLDYIAVAAEKKENSKMKFFIAGAVAENENLGPSLESLTLECQNAEISYLGFTENIINLFDTMDVIIFPSTYNEGVPRILLEALASGVIILSYSIPGTKDLLKNYPLKIPTNEYTSLVVLLEKVASLAPAEIGHIAQIGREIVEKDYSVDRVVHEYNKQLTRVLGNVV